MHVCVLARMRVCGGRRPLWRYTLTAYAAAMAMLFSRQKPWEPWGSLAQATTPPGPAWCPGGRTAQKALLACAEPQKYDPERWAVTCGRDFRSPSHARRDRSTRYDTPTTNGIW